MVLDSWRFNPLASVVEVGIKTSRSNDQVCRLDGTMLNIFEDGFEDAAHFTFAVLEETRGMGVPIDR